MRKDTFKLLVFAGIVGFAILYGMELSNKGIREVNGPFPTEGTAAVGQSDAGETDDWTLPVTGKAGGSRSSGTASDRTDDWDDGTALVDDGDESVAIPRNDREPIVDRVSGKTGEVLHDLSRNGIKAVVSLFDKVLG
ncbi:hypothetical protein ACFPPD_23380 [Cohnella suwonensis]|uniref:Uncharacterized protein n=1 Tax=Cohnella suwonensis TaxID=696072 RepID=A0ABW0M354_9BACL